MITDTENFGSKARLSIFLKSIAQNKVLQYVISLPCWVKFYHL